MTKTKKPYTTSRALAGSIEKQRARFFLSLLELWVINTENESEVEKCKKIEDITKRAKKIVHIILGKRPKGKQQTIDINNIKMINEAIIQGNNERALKKIQHSVEKLGLKNPLVVREVKEGFQLVVGYLHYEACRRLKLTKIPVIIKKLNDRETEELNLLDTLERNGHDDIEPEQLRSILKFYNQKVN